MKRRKPEEEGAPRHALRYASVLAIVCLVFVCGLLALGVPAFLAMRTQAQIANCYGCHFNMILFACSNYRHEYGSLPPPVVTDRQGRPMHSWRVLILPYLGYEDLYKRYDFTEPWDGPSNRLLIDQMPDVYRCPAATNKDKTVTNFVAVVGKGTGWGPPMAARTRYPPAVTWQKAAIAEVADPTIKWTEPRDMDVGQAMLGVNVDRNRGISSNHPNGAHVGSLIAMECFFRNDTTTKDLKKLLLLWETER